MDLNSELSTLFLELSKRESHPYKSLTYFNFSKLIKDKNLDRLDELSRIKGVGPTCIGIVKEYLEYGTCSKLAEIDDAENDEPKSELSSIPGIGPKKAEILKSAGYNSINDVVKLNLNEGDYIPGTKMRFTNSLRIGFKYKAHTGNKMSRSEFKTIAYPFISKLKAELDNKDIKLVGSYRRGLNFIGDIDVVIFYEIDYDIDKYRRVIRNELSDLEYMGSNKISGIISNKHVDIRIVDSRYKGPMLLHMTGPASFNVEMRKLAIEKGLKLSEYGLYDEDEIRLDDNTERSIFELLNLKYLKPLKRL